MPILNSLSRDHQNADENSDERRLLASEEAMAIADVPDFKTEAHSSSEIANSVHTTKDCKQNTSSPSQPAGNNKISQIPDTGGGSGEGGSGTGDGEAEKVTVSYFSLYRFSNKCEKLLVVLGLLIAILTGIVPAFANFAFGEFTTTIVAFASNTSRQCPPAPSNDTSTSPFMKEVEKFVLFQSTLGVAELFFGYLFVMFLNYVAEKQCFKIRKEYFRKILQQEIGWFDKNAKRDFSSRMVDDMLKVQNAMSEKIGMFVSAIVNCVFLTALSFLMGWKLTLAMIVFIPLLAVVSGIDSTIQNKFTTKEQDAYAEAGSIAEEVLSNIKTVHAFNGQEKEIKRYDEKILHAKKVAYKRHFLRGLGNGLTWFVCLANFAYAFWYGSVLVVHSRETGDGLYEPGNVLVILFSVMMTGFYFGSSADYIEAVSGGTGAAPSIFSILERESEINSASPDGLIPPEKPKGDIEFKDVGFSYPTRSDVPVLKKVCLRVQPGHTVALVGASGCGKSTCVQLLQRLYDADNGEITLDGISIKDLNIRWLRTQLGVVGQEPVLFNMTIAKNITFGLKDVSEEEVKAAAKLAYAHKFIMQLPQGYDTLVGERGASLSGGQKQRIAIARALVRNPSVLLLDEATSALDFQSESIVQAALEQASRGRSTIIIAHRLSTIKAADKIYVIEKGDVVEEGTHYELMELRGRYYQLVLKQEDKELESSLATINEESQLQEGFQENIENETEEYMLGDPGTGRITSRTRLISQTSVESIPVVNFSPKEKEEEEEKELSGSLSFLRLWKTNAKEWPYLVVVFLCSVVKGLQLPAYALIFGDFIQSFTLKDDTAVINYGTYYCFLYLGIAVVIGVCGFLQMTLVGIAGECFTYRVRKLLFSSLMEQDASFFDDQKNTVGKLTARLSTDASSIRGATGSRITGLLQAFSIVIAAGAMSFYYLPNMAAITVLFVPVVMYVSLMEGKVLGDENVAERDSVESACNVAVEALSNIRTVASLCAEEPFMEMYEESLLVAHRINLKRAHVRGFVNGIINGAPMICYCLSLWYGAHLVEQKCASIGSVFKVAEALIYCTMSGGAAISYAPDYVKGKLAAARIFKLLDTKPVIDRFSTNIALGTVRGQVDFKDVNFHYRSRPAVKVLKNLNLHVNAGDSVAICGPSGSGKSTCAALIFRFYDPVSGCVQFDEFDIRRVNLDFLRQQIALVSQEPILFDCSIKENIAYGDNSREMGMDEIIEAAIATNMHNFISSLPAGYETRVGMLGNQMSGGQKQRIAIARAIIRRPKLLVLDEATSALDSESEVAVQTALDSAKEGRTSITIAHRLSSIANSDKIFVMKNGIIEECGKHSELINHGGIYQTMWRAQSSQREHETEK